MQLSAGHRTKSRTALSLTPLIDVVFILLLFFMLISNFEQRRTIPVLSDVAVSQQSLFANELPTLRISRDQITLAGKSIALAELARQVKLLPTANPETVLMVRADADVHLQRIVHVMDGLSKAGIRRTRLQLDTKTATVPQ